VTPAEFRSRYESLFAMFLEERNERSLRAVYELGRDAVKDELSVLEVAGAHHDALARALAGASHEALLAICTAAGDFLVESLAAFEMVQRGSSAARRTALAERRNARMLRKLSTILADESLAAGDPESLHEVLQLVAEQAREMTDARHASVHVGGRGRANPIDARAESDDDDIWSEVLGPRKSAPPRSGRMQASITAPLLSLDGSLLGQIEVADKQGRAFSPSDQAVLNQVAQMAAAAVERALAYT
jgi:GAF domain-containing protein